MSVEFETAGNPHGEHGRSMLARMNASHEPLTEWSLDFVGFSPDDHVLDIGCGGGKAIQRILSRLNGGSVIGIDHSKLCVAESKALNAHEIESGIVDVRLASISSLPFEDNTFDVATGFETIYFWPEVEHDLGEVFRVLKPGGALLLANDDSVPDTEEIKTIQRLVEVPMTIFTPEELESLFIKAGFSDIEVHTKVDADCVCVLGRKPLR